MSVYTNDTTAAAVVLYEDCDLRYQVVNSSFNLKTTYMVRIKVLKPGGLDWADISIPFYSSQSGGRSERITGIAGFTYNMEDGKTEKIKLSKDYIFEEKTSENYRRMKIAFQNVKVGSIFELKYEKHSPIYGYIDDYIFQRSIPVRYSKYTVSIPEYFNYKNRESGYEKITSTVKPSNTVLIFPEGTLRCNSTETTHIANNLPALKEDNYVWNKNDYISKITYDITGVVVPGVIHENFSTNWQNIDATLMDDQSFGRQLKLSNLMKDELSSAIKDITSPKEKIEAILHLVKQKIQWNDNNVLYIDNVKKAIKDGVGSSAEMNAALLSLLRDAGFNAYPVVLSLRNRGRIFSMYPSLKSLNYFIVGVDIDGEKSYLDASYKYGGIDLVSPDCMVQEARCIYFDRPGNWVDIHEIGRNIVVTTIQVAFNEEGKLSGTMEQKMNGIPCAIYRYRVDKQKSVEDYIQEIENKRNITVSDLQQGEPKGVDVTETYTFEINDITLGGDYIYINSLIFPEMKENPFKEETRKLPVEYPYPFDSYIIVKFTIPEGYAIEELPSNERIFFDEKKSITYTYLGQKIENQINATQRFNMKRTLYSSLEYEVLRDFWTKVSSKNNEQLILKKNPQ
ncbi:MAG: DUF3857 domain-containing protein [Bacteroidales bacterium]|nr:DUF3857 domain-containing protein [Bacteroidales bacterium]